MTRDKLLEYITEKHKAALKRVDAEPTDTQENLFFILNDAMNGADTAAQKAIADREVATFIADKKAMRQVEASPQADEPVADDVKENA